jgi:ABC-type multidrug transport system fused ATPase/permease subunit
MRLLVRSYWDALLGFRRGAVVFVVLLAAAGLFEGLALSALIPALNAGLSQGEGPGFLTRWIVPAHASKSDAIAHGLVAFAILGLTAAVLSFLVERRSLQIRFQVERALRVRVTDALLAMGWLPYLEMQMADIAKSTMLEGSTIGIGAQALLRAMGNSIAVVVLFGVAVLLSPWLSLIALVFGVLVGTAYRFVRQRAARHSQEAARVANAIAGNITDLFGNFKYLRSTGSLGQGAERATTQYQQFETASFRATVLSTITRLMFEGGGVLLVAGFLAISLLVSGQSVGASLVFLAVFYRLAPRVTAVNDYLYHASVYLPWFESWKRVYDAATKAQEHEQGHTAVSSVANVRMETVGFCYPSRSRPTIEGIDLHIESGRCTAIVGESGSGKTTILDLLTGLLRPTSGQINVGAAPLTTLNQLSWRQHIGVVMQDAPLRHASVLENVTFSVDGADPEKARRCLERADAWDFVERLPHGIDTDIGEAGAALSGGQRQRLALARALYRDPALLLLDEATSALDAESEAQILQTVAEIKKDCAVVIVSHRMSAAMVADEIVVLSGGRIVERGTWAELTGAGSLFQTMLERQRYPAADDELASPPTTRP